jgi:hypothetical protein
MSRRIIKLLGVDPANLALARELRRRERAKLGSETLSRAAFKGASHSFGAEERALTFDFNNAVVVNSGMSNVLLVSLRKPIIDYDSMDLIRIKQLSNIRNADSVLIKANSHAVDIEFILDISEWGSQNNTEIAFLNADLSNREVLSSEGIPFFPLESDALSTLKMVNNAREHFLIEPSSTSEVSPLNIYQRPYRYEDVVFVEIDKNYLMSPLSFKPTLGVESYDILISNLTQKILSIGAKKQKQVVVVLYDKPREQVVAAINLLKNKVERMNGNLVVLLPEERVLSVVDGMNRLRAANLEAFTDRNSALKKLKELKAEVIIPCPDFGWGLIEKPKPINGGFHIQVGYKGSISKDNERLLALLDEDFKGLAKLRNVLMKGRALLIDFGNIEVRDIVAAEYLKVSHERLSGLNSVIYSCNRKTTLELGEHRVEVYDDLSEAKERLKENSGPLLNQHRLKGFKAKPLSNSFLFTLDASDSNQIIKACFEDDILIMKGVKEREDGRAGLILDFGKAEFDLEAIQLIKAKVKEFFVKNNIPFIILAEDDFTRADFSCEGFPTCEHIVEGKEYLDGLMAKRIIPPPRGWNYIEVPEFFGDGFEVYFNKKVLGSHIKSAIREDFYALANATSKKQLAYRNFIINFKSLAVDPDEIPLLKECFHMLDEAKLHYVALAESKSTKELFERSKIPVSDRMEDAKELLPFSPMRW